MLAEQRLSENLIIMEERNLLVEEIDAMYL